MKLEIDKDLQRKLVWLVTYVTTRSVSPSLPLRIVADSANNAVESFDKEFPDGK